MNTPFQEVFDAFLSKVVEYNFLSLTEEELEEELTMKLKSAFPKAMLKDVKLDLDYGEFTRELSALEIEALSYWLVYEWITPKVNNVELFQYRLGSKDYERFSEANHLRTMIEIKNDAYSQARYYSNRINTSDILKGLI